MFAVGTCPYLLRGVRLQPDPITSPVRSCWVKLEGANHEPGRFDIENALARKNVGHSIKRLTSGRPGYCWATTHTFVSNNDTTRSRLRPIAPQRPCASPFE